MSRRDLTAKYGNHSGYRLINMAIRAELPGGHEALDALDRLRTSGNAEGLALVRDIVDAMAHEIRRRYNMPPREE